MNFLNGKKTYIVAAATVLYAVAGVLSGHIDYNTAATLIGPALLGSTVRHGIATSAQ